ncbi:heparinase II/III family protein [bacterium]|nr:heparinase II/III family protein [bacterium]
MKIIQSFKILFLYLNTVRHLRTKQILYRVLKTLPKRQSRIPEELYFNTLKRPFMRPISKPDSYISDGKFWFLDELGNLDDIGWAGSGKSALWRYNQHYFDWLLSDRASRDQSSFRMLTKNWIKNNQNLKAIAWDPYPTSLRLVNWIKAINSCQEMPSNAHLSLYIQAQHLFDRIEWHLMGNHLFANAKALVFAGAFFEGKEPKKWFLRGLEILKQQIHEQILVDGGHFELSPMYHSIILEDCLDIYNILHTYNLDCPNAEDLKNKICARVPAMLDWLSYMTFTDCEIAHFNDSVSGVAPSLSKLHDYALRLGFAPRVDINDVENVGLTYLEGTGYVHFKSKTCKAILDVGNVGPQYQPGHAHADTLSFELGIENKRFIVNSGTSCYGRTELRKFQRSTLAHSTVVVEGRDSSEVWSSFRVAKRAKPVAMVIDYDRFRVRCEHDGYKSLPGSPSHRREWRFGSELIEVHDFVDNSDLDAIALFYIHPDWELKKSTVGVEFFVNKITVVMDCNTPDYSIVATKYYPAFNQCVKNYCVKVRLKNGSSKVTFSWNSSENTIYQ